MIKKTRPHVSVETVCQSRNLKHSAMGQMATPVVSSVQISEPLVDIHMKKKNNNMKKKKKKKKQKKKKKKKKKKKNKKKTNKKEHTLR